MVANSTGNAQTISAAGKAGVVRIGVCDASRFGAGQEAALAPDERSQARAISDPRRWRQYVASRWLLRTHTARCLGLAPEAIRLRYPSNSAPLLVNSEAKLGLSHSAGVCLCVFAVQAAVGCDVESMRPRPRALAIAAQYFHESESAALAAGELPRDFYRLWALKEAALKAQGKGIADGGLRAPAFALQPRLRCLLAPAGGGDWRFAAANLTFGHDGYALAVAVAGRLTPGGYSLCRYQPDAASECPAHEPLSDAWTCVSAEPAAAR